jgi:MscS family membrane protein
MKLKFETCFRGLLIFLLIVAACSLWAGAETNTNAAATTVAKTNQPPALALEVQQHLEQRYLTFGLDRVPALREIHLLGEPLWKYLASVIYILLVFYIAKLFDLIAIVWLKRLAAKTQTRLDDLLLELLHGPIKIIAFAILLQIGLNIFDWSDSTRLYLSKGLILVVAAALTYLTIKVVDVLLEFWRARAAHEDKRFDDQLFSVIRKSLKVFVVVVALLVTASNIGINITAAITSLSIGGLAVGLAAQDTLANLFGAVAIFADKPFQVGDSIRLDVAEGAVESVGLRSTRLRNPDGHLVSIPNKTMGNAAITNVSQRPNIRTTMNLALARNLSAEKVQQALQILDQVYRKHPMTKDVWISFNQFALANTGTNLNIMIVHWWQGLDHQKYLAGMQEMNLAVKQRFDAEGIAFG